LGKKVTLLGKIRGYINSFKIPFSGDFINTIKGKIPIMGYLVLDMVVLGFLTFQKVILGE